MKRLYVQATLMLLVGAISFAAQAQSLHGAWTLERYQFSGENINGSVDPAQESLFLFTEAHYSISYALGNEPRPLLPDTPGPEDLADAYRSFVSNSGSYASTNNELITYPIITRNPNVTADPVLPVRYEYSIKQDTLFLTLPEAPGDVKVRVDYVLSRLNDQ